MLTFLNTRPHVTLSLFKCDDPPDLARELIGKLPAIAATLPTAPSSVEPGGDPVSMLGAHVDGEVSAGGGWYRIEKPPSWYRLADAVTSSSDDDDVELEPSAAHSVIRDVQNHLVVVATYKSYLAVFASQDAMRQRLGELVTTGVSGSDTAAVALTRTGLRIDRQELENAFVRGKTKSAWLEGLHVPTDLKADRKVLSGPNLRYALDHFDDQSFAYSATISEVLRGSQTHRVGVSHAKGTLWTKATKAFAEFVAELRVLVDALELGNTDPTTLGELDRAGLPVVAKPSVTANLKDLDDGFDVGYEASTTAEAEVLFGGVNEAVASMDEWQRHGSFVVDEKATKACAIKSQIVAVAHFDDRPIATLRFEPIRRTDTSVDILYRVVEYAVRKDDPDMVALG